MKRIATESFQLGHHLSSGDLRFNEKVEYMTIIVQDDDTGTDAACCCGDGGCSSTMLLAELPGSGRVSCALLAHIAHAPALTLLLALCV